MLRRILFSLIFATSALAADVPGDKDRQAAFERLSNEALATKLIDQAAADIKVGHYEAALKKSEAAEAIRPNDPAILNTKGAALLELKRFSEAGKAFDVATELDPNAFAPQFNKGEMFTSQKKYSDAAVQFAVLRSRFGDLPLLKYEIYLCYALQGQKDLAEDALLAMRYPADGAAWYYAHAVDQIQSGNRKEGRRLISAAEAIHSDDLENYRDSLRDAGLLP